MGNMERSMKNPCFNGVLMLKIKVNEGFDSMFDSQQGIPKELANEVRYHPEFDWFNDLMRFVMMMMMMMMIPITFTRAPAVYKHKS